MAVYTKLDKEKLNAILSNYNLGEIKRFSEIKEGIENTNYLIQTNNSLHVQEFL